MPILQDISPVDMEFGTGDIGFRTFLVKNYPVSTGHYESRGVLEIHQLKQAYGAGSVAKTPQETRERFEDINHPEAVMTFPANNPTSLDMVIAALTRLRDETYSYWTVIYKKYYGHPLHAGFTVNNSYDSAEASLKRFEEHNVCNELMIIPVKVKTQDVEEDKYGILRLKKEYKYQ